MATIIERNGRFLARVRIQGFKPVSKTFHRRSDATAWGKSVEADMQAGRWQDATTAVPTLREAIARYKACVAHKLKGATTYAYWLNELAATPMAAKAIDKLTAADLSEWRDSLTLKVKPGTVARKLGLVSGLLTWAQKDCGWLAANPMHLVRKPRVTDARTRTVTPEEMHFLHQAASTSRARWLADVLTVLQTSAMRRSELWALVPNRIDFANSIAHLPDTKNGSARDVPLCPEALAALRRLEERAQTRQSSTLVPVASPHAVSLAFRRTLGKRGLTTLCPLTALGGMLA